jgi:pyruvate carboxylase
VFLERYIRRARHIEIQILADHHGNILHLHERDCSVQRRNQKVVEVAPAVSLPAAIRSALADAAVSLAKRAGYETQELWSFWWTPTPAAGISSR